jgi:hypothetical protein
MMDSDSINEIEEVFSTQRDSADDEVYTCSLYYDADGDHVRVRINKDNIDFKTCDWSEKMAWLKDLGYHVTGMTTDRYEEFIYIWVEEW